ncbi:MAG: hypothetical protein LUI87_17355, partial [Lachnospiraceae bacterium]|nr:hypothetical protein [Lachnospiraceae bacterium]
MTWLIQLLIEAIREQCSQFIVDAMEVITELFTDLLSCDLTLFEELFSVVGSLYRNVILPLSVALLLMIFTWQLFKSMFGVAGMEGEDPIQLTCRSAVCLFMIFGAKSVLNYVLNIAGTPYSWVVGTDIEVVNFSEYVSALSVITATLGIDSVSVSLLMLIMQFVVAWNYFKMLQIIAERYVLLGVMSYTAPLAFATGGSKATNNILNSWCKMFGGQVILVILNAWCMKLFLAGYGNMLASGYGFTKFFAATLCLVGFCKITFKLDSYMASLGVSMGRTAGGMGGMALMMAAGRMLSRFGGGGFNFQGGFFGGGDTWSWPTGGGIAPAGGGGDGGAEAFTPIPLSADGGNEEETRASGNPGAFSDGETEVGGASETSSYHAGTSIFEELGESAGENMSNPEVSSGGVFGNPSEEISDMAADGESPLEVSMLNSGTEGTPLPQDGEDTGRHPVFGDEARNAAISVQETGLTEGMETSFTDISESETADGLEASFKDMPEMESTDGSETEFTGMPQTGLAGKSGSGISDMPEAEAEDGSEARFTDMPETEMSAEPEAGFTDMPETETSDESETEFTDIPEAEMSDGSKIGFTDIGTETDYMDMPEAKTSDGSETGFTDIPEKELTDSSEIGFTGSPQTGFAGKSGSGIPDMPKAGAIDESGSGFTDISETGYESTQESGLADEFASEFRGEPADGQTGESEFKAATGEGLAGGLSVGGSFGNQRFSEAGNDEPLQEADPSIFNAEGQQPDGSDSTFYAGMSGQGIHSETRTVGTSAEMRNGSQMPEETGSEAATASFSKPLQQDLISRGVLSEIESAGEVNPAGQETMRGNPNEGKDVGTYNRNEAGIYGEVQSGIGSDMSVTGIDGLSEDTGERSGYHEPGCSETEATGNPEKSFLGELGDTSGTGTVGAVNSEEANSGVQSENPVGAEPGFRMQSDSGNGAGSVSGFE